MNPNTTNCPDCGEPLPPDSPQSLCPACLMRQALASRTVADGGNKAPVSPPWSPEEIADKFPGYEILECLGRGGMGVVYKARQKSLGRLVAIKILPPERVGEVKFSDRFAIEAATLARLSHPNIVTVHDFGETGGLFYIVMEYVDGVNLRDLLREGKLEPKQALAIVPPICEALQYAHDKGIVHRDIKPENLLLDKDGRVKIADFGIASLMGAAGEIAGTPPYMAPEQKGAKTDHRADIYALGVVLYEMLTGERPDKELIAPSRKVQIDVRLDEMVLRALEKEPEKRYQTAGEFRTVVETFAQDKPATDPSHDRTSLLKSGESLYATPGFLATVWGAMKIHEGMGALMLYQDRLEFRAGLDRTIIPLRSILRLERVTYPLLQSPAGLRSIEVEFEDGGGTRRLLLTPSRGMFSFIGTTNRLVLEWFGAIREAYTALVGSPPEGSPTPVPYRGFSGDGRLLSGLMMLGALVFAVSVLAAMTVTGSWRNLYPMVIPFVFGLSFVIALACRQRRQWILEHPLPYGGETKAPPGPGFQGIGEGTQPSFSRTAIAGACLACLVFAVPALPLKVLVAAPVAFAVTVLGWIAVSQIRCSNGNLHGLRLAVFDGLLFPLLAVDAAVVVPMWRFVERGSGHGMVPFWSLLLVGLSGIVLFLGNVLLIRWVWRKVTDNQSKPPSIGWATLAIALSLAVALQLWKSTSRSYPGSSLSSRFDAPVMGVVTFNYSHPNRASRGGGTTIGVRAYGDTLWFPSSGQSITLKDGSSIWMKFRVNAIRPDAPLALVTASADGNRWETKRWKLLPGDIAGSLVFSNGLKVFITWTPVANGSYGENKPDPVQLEVARAASAAADRQYPVGISGEQRPDASRPTFGETVFLMVPEPHADTACVLNFETGKLLVPPAGLAGKLQRGEVKLDDDEQQWLRGNGADAVINMPAKEHGYSLRLFEGMAFSQGPTGQAPLGFDDYTPSSVEATIRGAEFENRARFSNSTNSFYATPSVGQVAMVFITREGGMGVLQVHGPNPNPPGARIRYKMVQYMTESPVEAPGEPIHSNVPPVPGYAADGGVPPVPGYPAHEGAPPVKGYDQTQDGVKTGEHNTSATESRDGTN